MGRREERERGRPDSAGPLTEDGSMNVDAD
jgi:hypothetical protein